MKYINCITCGKRVPLTSPNKKGCLQCTWKRTHESKKITFSNLKHQARLYVQGKISRTQIRYSGIAQKQAVDKEIRRLMRIP